MTQSEFFQVVLLVLGPAPEKPKWGEAGMVDYAEYVGEFRLLMRVYMLDPDSWVRHAPFGQKLMFKRWQYWLTDYHKWWDEQHRSDVLRRQG